MSYKNIREEELKNKVGQDWFKQFNTTEIVGNIDFTVFHKKETKTDRTPLLWAEAKTGDFDIPTMFVQLILTIGKARTFDKTLPPAFLGAFDYKKIAFVPYNIVQDIFYMNDFNWNVTPSNHESKEFKLIKERIEKTLQNNSHIYEFSKDEKDLKSFIANNIAMASEVNNVKIDKNNFIPIYLRWLEIIKPNIDVNWDNLKKVNILDSDFYLADLFVNDNDTQTIEDDLSIRDSLFVVFQNQGYRIAKENIPQQVFDSIINIRSKEVYQQFWKRYKRPPLKDFQDYIIERRDLLVPQDIRERKGAFFTPRIWVELSQKYIADYLGEDWQDEYYIWDCAAGTGNLLAGLTNKYHIYASTLDQADVKVMHERIEHGANLLENHVFQFDFLNDDFSKLPKSLQAIINDPKKRKKLVIYINPPYAESNGKVSLNRSDIQNTLIHKKYSKQIDKVKSELYAQFIARIYFELQGTTIAQFSKLKLLNGTNSSIFRLNFLAKLEKLFLVQADTFDNVKGKFPIGFFIWNTNEIEQFKEFNADIFNTLGNSIGVKALYSYDKNKRINDWLKKFEDKKSQNIIGVLMGDAPDFQSNNYISILNNKGIRHGIYFSISNSNLIVASIYLAVRHCIEATWLNDRDQFLYPNDQWEKDIEFQRDCIIFTLFHSQNRISCNESPNHWIPFTEVEVDAKERFESHFMTDFLSGPIRPQIKKDIFTDTSRVEEPIPTYHTTPKYSDEAKSVFDAGRELWAYYHSNKYININASLYDIREHYQGRNDKGKMNNKSLDEKYNELISNLRTRLKVLAKKIEPKVYEYEFLKA